MSEIDPSIGINIDPQVVGLVVGAAVVAASFYAGRGLVELWGDVKRRVSIRQTGISSKAVNTGVWHPLDLDTLNSYD
jgi:hypothetical protein